MGRLTTKQRESYVQETILPVFQSMSNSNSYTTLFSVDAKILFITEKSAASIAMDSPDKCIGMTYAAPLEDYILGLKQKYELETDNIISACSKIYQLQLSAVNHQKSVSYIDMIPYSGKFYAYLCILTPIFHPNGEVVALLANSVKHYLFGLHEFITTTIQYCNPVLNPLSAENFEVNLSKRQHEILFLISNGFSQGAVAEMLRITRGTVAKTITTQLCPKFNVVDNDSVKLIELARQMKLHEQIPQSLWRQYIVSLEKDDELEGEVNLFNF